MSPIYWHLDYSFGLEHPEYFPLFALIPVTCLPWNILTDSPKSQSPPKAANSLSKHVFLSLFSPNLLSQTPFGAPQFFQPYLVSSSLTQVADGFLVPRPGGSTCEVFPYGAGEVDVEKVCAVELQRLLQLLHTHVRPGEHTGGEVITPRDRHTRDSRIRTTHTRALPACVAL